MVTLVVRGQSYLVFDHVTDPGEFFSGVYQMPDPSSYRTNRNSNFIWEIYTGTPDVGTFDIRIQGSLDNVDAEFVDIANSAPTEAIKIIKSNSNARFIRFRHVARIGGTSSTLKFYTL